MLNYNRPLRESLERAKRSQKNIHTASIVLRPQDSYSDALYIPLKETLNRKLDSQSHNNNSSLTLGKKLLDRSVRLEKSPSLRQQDRSKEKERQSQIDNKHNDRNNDRNEKTDREKDKQNRLDSSTAGLKAEYKLKIFQDNSQGRVETDRKSLRKSMEKSMKTIRLKTDYQEVMQVREKSKENVRADQQYLQQFRQSFLQQTPSQPGTGLNTGVATANTSKLEHKMSQNQVSTKNTEEFSNRVVYLPRSELAKLKSLFQKLQDENSELKREIGFHCKKASGKIASSKRKTNSVLKALG